MAATAEKVVSQIEEIPSSCVCTITQQIMVEPVMASDGQTYEREAIERHLRTGSERSPNTQVPLFGLLTPNIALKQMILNFLDRNPDQWEEVYLPETWVENLIMAIKENNPTKVQDCLSKDKRLLTVKLEGEYTAFHLAVKNNSLDAASMLLDYLIKRKELNKISPTSERLYLGSLLEQVLLDEFPNEERFNGLLKLGADLYQKEPSNGNTLLHKLAMRGDPGPIKWLLAKGFPIDQLVDQRNNHGNTPLLLSLLERHVEVTKFLLEMKADPRVKNNKGRSALYIALSSKNLIERKDDCELIELLLNHLVSSTDRDLPMTHLALMLNDLELLKFSLEDASKKLSSESFNETVQTLFDRLLVNDKIEIKQRAEAANLLLKAGASSKKIYNNEETTLHLAVRKGDVSMLKLLLTTKAACLINSGNVDGNTPLHLAAQLTEGDPAIVLLKAGADPNIVNNEGLTPPGWARKEKLPKRASKIENTAREVQALEKTNFRKLQRLIEAQAKEIKQLKEQVTRLETMLSTERKLKYEGEVEKLHSGSGGNQLTGRSSQSSPMIFSSSPLSCASSSSSSASSLSPALSSSIPVQSSINLT